MSDLPGLLEVIANNTVSHVRLNAETLAVLLYALDKIANPKTWLDYRGEFMSQADIELIHELVDLAADDIMRPVVMTPVGAIMMWLEETPPEDWFWLDGGGVLKLEYPELYALYGGRYADTTDFFGLPDWRYKSPMGATFAEELDTFDGAMTHTLTTAQLPVHNHSVIDPGHDHRIPKMSATVNAGVNTSTPNARTDNPAAPVMRTDAAGTGISIGNTGTGAAHNNLHPVAYCLYIVYAGQKA